MKQLYILLIACIASINAFAQIPAPRLQCVTQRFNGDIDIAWTLPNVTCGAVTGYDIYASSTGLNGSYTLLTTINNPAVTTFSHIGANGNNLVWNYYLTTNTTCSAGIPIHSDTIDNRPPAPPDFQFVGMVGNQVLVSWEPDTEPETYAHVIYDARTNTALDTVFGRGINTFTDNRPQLDTGVQRYTIVAMDSCFNSGIVNVIHHHTLHTKSVIDRCAQTVSLSWNAYDNWAGGIKEHQIWVGINGSPMQPIDTLSATTFAYVFENAQDNTNYCFAVRAIEEGTNFYSQSNTFCRTLNVVQAMDFIYLANATVLPTTDLVELTWKWATNADLTAWGINQSDNNTTYNRFLVASPMQNLVLTNMLSLPNEPINERQIYYKIETIDSCNSSFFSNEVGTIFVKGVANYDFTNTITWTAYENRYGTVTDYQVWRVTAFGEELVATLNADARSFTEAIDYTVPTQNSLQYYIIAKANINYPDGTTDIIRSRSNTIKISPTLHIQFPNAFRPSGINNTFKPLALFADNTEYLLKIYDRWGGLVFETTDIDTGWDGTKNGKALPQACYFYLINAQQGENGQVFSQNGSVMLLR